jgi:WD40 repeat protein
MVKARLFQIAWHAKEGNKNDPILGLDFHPTLPLLATAGADCEVKLWRVRDPAAAAPAMAAVSASTADPQDRTPEASVEFLFSILAHSATVNAVRFSPNGECLASASDGKLDPYCRGSTVHPSLPQIKASLCGTQPASRKDGRA